MGKYEDKRVNYADYYNRDYYKERREKREKEEQEIIDSLVQKIRIRIVLFSAVAAVVGFGSGYLLGQKHVLDNAIVIKHI